jgi:phosphoribosylformylglycinamidine synthase
MTAYEMMLSESQERMLMILKPEREADARAIFTKWGLDFAIIGRTTDTQRMIITHKGNLEADLPVPVLANSAPMYERPWIEPKKPAKILPEWVPAPNSILGTLKDLMSGPHLSSRRWIWEQYDHMVMGDTVGRPGGDAGVVRVHGTKKAIAVACDVTPRYVTADPEEGTKQAVVETWRNLTAAGADPLAITDNMNFANPERPEIMGQFVASVRGMGEACRVLDYPVVSGNVSLYNETNGIGIPPTPAIGGVGLIPDASKLADIRLKTEGNMLIVIGREEGHLGQSIYQQHATGKFDGAPPPVDLESEVKAGRLVRSLIREGRVLAVHDCSDGGLLVAIAEMALAGGQHGLSREATGVGVELYPYEGKLPAHAIWFGEDQGRYVLEVTPQKAEEVLERARLLELPARIVGRIGGDAISLKGDTALPLSELRTAHEGWLPKLMSSELGA